jgi:hypothetical protein
MAATISSADFDVALQRANEDVTNTLNQLQRLKREQVRPRFPLYWSKLSVQTRRCSGEGLLSRSETQRPTTTHPTTVASLSTGTVSQPTAVRRNPTGSQPTLNPRSFSFAWWLSQRDSITRRLALFVQFRNSEIKAAVRNEALQSAKALKHLQEVATWSQLHLCRS